MSNLTNDHLSINRILVVIDPRDVLPARPDESALLRRAAQVARAANAEIELFYPCYDSSLDMTLFTNREEISREKERIANEAATRLAELALHMSDQGFSSVKHEVRWDHPIGDAILRKIHDSEADLVMKHSRGPNFIVGLSRHTDWDLIRRSQSHIWFVKDEKELTDTVLTAVGGTDIDEGIITESDDRVFNIGTHIADLLGAENHAMHCYQLPQVHAYATYTPFISGAAKAAAEPEPWQDLAELHGDAILRFANRVGLKADDVIVTKGQASAMLPAKAKSLGAGLLVMGARNLGRWERVFNPIAAEPVLAEAPCDLLLVRETDESEAPGTEHRPLQGEPDVNVEMAVVHPEKAFKSPLAVVEADRLTEELRHRILDIWEWDIEAQLREEDEGGPVQNTQAGILKEIDTARRQIKASAADSSSAS